jgi:hypothetical protein
MYQRSGNVKAFASNQAWVIGLGTMPSSLRIYDAAFFKWACRYWHVKAEGRIPYGFALYMRPGLFELRDRR